MPIFDDPRRELRRLQEQLLEQEEDEELDELMDEYGEADYEDCFEEDYEEEYTQEPFYRNYSNGYGADIRNFANGYRGEALFDEDDEYAYDDGDYDDEEPYAVFPEKRRLFRRRPKPQSKDKGLGKLKFILTLEIIGILAILIWWAVNLL